RGGPVPAPRCKKPETSAAQMAGGKGHTPRPPGWSSCRALGCARKLGAASCAAAARLGANTSFEVGACGRRRPAQRGEPGSARASARCGGISQLGRAANASLTHIAGRWSRASHYPRAPIGAAIGSLGDLAARRVC
nr:hypothetical protein [Tanacetum cinerariifolium]